LWSDELWLGLGFAWVVACFVGATVLAERRMGTITDWSRDVSDAALPTLVDIAQMREELHEIDATLASGRPAAATAPEQIASALERLEAQCRHGTALANVERDRSLWGDEREELAAIRRESMALLGAPDGRADPRSFHRRIGAADAALDSIVTFESERGRLSAVRAEAARSQTRGVAYGLDGLSVLIAGALGAYAVTSHRRHRRALELHMDELEMFAARAAHDIRGPLAPALLALEQVGASLTVDGPLRARVDRGLRSLHSIDRIVDGLLAFASAGARPQGGASATMSDAIDAVIAQYLDAAAAHGIELAAEPAAPVRVACSEGVLASILSNLVGNAIKYVGDTGERRVTVRSQRRASRMHVEVEDNGPGLAAGAGDRVFEPFVRGPTSRGGLGLGLATVKRLVLAHDGAIGVTRAAPRGCIFWVELPLSRTEGEAPKHET
jgi:signal transduction histidine kinase